MHSITLNPRWGLIVLIFALSACGATPNTPDQTVIQTIVAGTFQALTPSEPTVAPPASTEEPTLLKPNVDFEGISFVLDPALTNIWNYEITSPPDPASDNPFQSPSYYRLDFIDFVIPTGENIAWRIPRMYIIPVENLQSFPNGGYGLFALAQLQQILAAKPETITESMPVLPYAIKFNNGEAFHSNLQYINFQNGSGVRFLAEYTQVAFPIGRATSYIFQGLTNDGKYYVSLTLPISQTALNEFNASYEASITDEASYRAFSEIYSDYLLEAVAILENTPNADFSPNLATLDALVQSISVKP